MEVIGLIKIVLVMCLLLPWLLFGIIGVSCICLMGGNKNEDGYNFHNSSLGVQCDSKEKCDWRHTTMCNTCKYNCGTKEHKSNYVMK